MRSQAIRSWRSETATIRFNGVATPKRRRLWQARLIVFFREDGPSLVKAGRMRENTLRDYAKQAERHVKRGLGRIKVADVKRGDVVKMLAGVKGLTQRNRIQALTSRLFTTFESWGNP